MFWTLRRFIYIEAGQKLNLGMASQFHLSYFEVHLELALWNVQPMHINTYLC